MIKTELAPPRSAKVEVSNHQPTTEEIAARAYQLFVERGGEPGHDVEDWLRAEDELSHNHSN